METVLYEERLWNVRMRTMKYLTLTMRLPEAINQVTTLLKDIKTMTSNRNRTSLTTIIYPQEIATIPEKHTSLMTIQPILSRINKATLPLQFPMINFLSWNIRGIGSKGSLERLQHQLPLICLQEPMVDSGKIENYKRKLGMDHIFNNCSNKIWLLRTGDVIVTVLQDKEQNVLVRI